MEYLFIMGFTVLLIAPMLIIYYEQTGRLDEESTSAMVSRAATQIAEAADTVYYLGEPSLRTLTIDLPKNVKSVTIGGQSVAFAVDSSHGVYEQVAWSAANLTGSFSVTQGPHVLSLTAQENGVNISE